MTIFLNFQLEWIAIISFGFLGGVYFAFSFFVMRSLNELSGSEAIRIMTIINNIILKSPFMVLFFCSTVIAFLLVTTSLFFNKLFSYEAFSGFIFIIGMFLCTITRNVPLNKKLENLSFGDIKYEPEIEWSNYYHNWTKWNHVRTATCFVSSALLLIS